jgi:hypothetical protein
LRDAALRVIAARVGDEQVVGHSVFRFLIMRRQNSLPH